MQKLSGGMQSGFLHSVPPARVTATAYFIAQTAQVQPAGCCADAMSSPFIPHMLLHPVMVNAMPVITTSPSITDFIMLELLSMFVSVHTFGCTEVL